MNRRQSWNIITIFLLLLFGFTLASLIKPDRDFSAKENRVLSSRPKLTAEKLFSGEFEQEYETYITDQFVLRDSWISLKTLTERISGHQDVNDVYFAADDYLIERHSGVFETQQALDNRMYLTSFAKLLQQNSPQIRLNIMVVPTACVVLKEKLPPFASSSGQNGYISALRDNLPENVWFDAGQILSRHAGEEIYYRTDHHWKTRGAFYVFQAWAQIRGLGEYPEEFFRVSTVTEDFSGTVASRVGMNRIRDSIEVYEPVLDNPCRLIYNQDPEDVRHTLYNDQALDGHEKYGVFLGGNQSIIQCSTSCENGRSVLVIKDSYANCFIPFLTCCFEQVDVIDLRYYRQSLSELIGQNGYTDILFLYNAAGFASDTSLGRLLL